MRLFSLASASKPASLLAALLSASLLALAAGCDAAGGSETGSGDDGSGGDESSVEAPAAPSGLSSNPGDGAVSLTWEAASDADSYTLYRSEEPTDEATGSALDTGISQASYTDEAAENGTTYYYRVTAVARADGETAESGASEEAEATPFSPPSELEGTSGDEQVQLQWKEGTGAEAYNVYRSTESTSGAEGEPLKSGVSEATYTDETAENGTTYYYRVTALNPEETESTASNEVEKTPFANPPDRPR